MFNLPIFTAFNGLLFYRWVSLARGDHSCDQCGKSFINGAHLKNHIKQDHEVRYTTSSPYFFKRCLNLVIKLTSEAERDNSQEQKEREKSEGHEVVYHSLEVKKIIGGQCPEHQNTYQIQIQIQCLNYEYKYKYR